MFEHIPTPCKVFAVATAVVGVIAITTTYCPYFAPTKSSHTLKAEEDKPVQEKKSE